jgi:hypothetical protein
MMVQPHTATMILDGVAVAMTKDNPSLMADYRRQLVDTVLEDAARHGWNIHEPHLIFDRLDLPEDQGGGVRLTAILAADPRLKVQIVGGEHDGMLTDPAMTNGWAPPPSITLMGHSKRETEYLRDGINSTTRQWIYRSKKLTGTPPARQDAA